MPKFQCSVRIFTRDSHICYSAYILSSVRT